MQLSSSDSHILLYTQQPCRHKAPATNLKKLLRAIASQMLMQAILNLIFPKTEFDFNFTGIAKSIFKIKEHCIRVRFFL